MSEELAPKPARRWRLYPAGQRIGVVIDMLAARPDIANAADLNSYFHVTFATKEEAELMAADIERYMAGQVRYVVEQALAAQAGRLDAPPEQR